MADLYKPICTRCDDKGRYTLATEKHMGEDYCSDCLSDMAETAHERSLEDFYGGSSPQSIAELSDRAYRERAELRRRD